MTALLRHRKQRPPTACPLQVPDLTEEERDEDRADLLSAEVDRLRTLLYGGSPVRALHDRWCKEADALEQGTYKTDHGRAEAHQRARKLRLFAGELGKAAGYV